MRVNTWIIIVVSLAIIIGVYVYQYYAVQSTSIEPMPSKGIFIIENGHLKPANITKIPPSNNTVIIALLLSTCPHCRAFWPTLYKVAREMEGKIKFYFIIFRPPVSGHMREIAYYFYNKKLWDGSVPALIVYKNGSYVATWVGRMSEEELLSRIKEIS